MRTWFALASILFIFVLTSCLPAADANLRILTEDYPPYNFAGPDTQVIGQSTEIVQAILKKLGKPAAAIEIMPLSEALTLANKGSGIAVYSINRTAKRENSYKWVGSIGAYEQALYARKGSGLNISSLEEAKEVNGLIAVYKGDAGNYYLQSQGFTNLDESPTDVEALKSLVSGKAVLWLGNRQGLIITAAEAGANYEELQLMVPVMRSELYIAFSKDTPDAVIRAWQSALDSLKTDKGPDGRTFFEGVTQKYADAYYLKQVLAK